jgi:hypothetical protein
MTFASTIVDAFTCRSFIPISSGKLTCALDVYARIHRPPKFSTTAIKTRKTMMPPMITATRAI